MVNIWSMGIILLVFTVICAISVYTAKKKVVLNFIKNEKIVDK